MMNIRLITVLTLILLCTMVCEAQERLPKFGLASLYVFEGSPLAQSTQKFRPRDLKRAIPESNIIKHNEDKLSNASGQTYFYRNIFYDNILSVQAGFQGRPTHPDWEFRTGFSYGRVREYSIYGSKSNSTRVDSIPYGTRYWYIDSVYYEGISVSNSGNHLSFDISFLFKTAAHRQFSLYAGYGFSGAISINAITHVNYYSLNQFQMNEMPLWNYKSMETRVSENFRIGRYRTISFFVPAGIDFRLGRGPNTFSRLHLLLEAQGGISYTDIPYLAYITFNYFHGFIGMRYRLK